MLEPGIFVAGEVVNESIEKVNFVGSSADTVITFSPL